MKNKYHEKETNRFSIDLVNGSMSVDARRSSSAGARATAESAAHDIRSGRKRRREKDNEKEKTKGPILVSFMFQIAL